MGVPIKLPVTTSISLKVHIRSGAPLDSLQSLTSWTYIDLELCNFCSNLERL